MVKQDVVRTINGMIPRTPKT